MGTFRNGPCTPKIGVPFHKFRGFRSPLDAVYHIGNPSGPPFGSQEEREIGHMQVSVGKERPAGAYTAGCADTLGLDLLHGPARTPRTRRGHGAECSKTHCKPSFDLSWRPGNSSREFCKMPDIRYLHDNHEAAISASVRRLARALLGSLPGFHKRRDRREGP